MTGASALKTYRRNWMLWKRDPHTQNTPTYPMGKHWLSHWQLPPVQAGFGPCWSLANTLRGISDSHILHADFGSPSRPKWASRCQKWVVLFYTVWETSSGPPSLSPGVAPTAHIKQSCIVTWTIYVYVVDWIIGILICDCSKTMLISGNHTKVQ